jgi:N-acetylglutamate synthase/N-acetylornithine aminotransferase
MCVPYDNLEDNSRDIQQNDLCTVSTDCGSAGIFTYKHTRRHCVFSSTKRVHHQRRLLKIILLSAKHISVMWADCFNGAWPQLCLNSPESLNIQDVAYAS